MKKIFIQDKIMIALTLGMAMLGIAPHAIAVDRWVFSGGGGYTSSGDAQLHSVIGQPVTGFDSTGATYLSSGFLFEQTSGGPTPTPGPSDFGVRIDMPDMVHPGDPFWVTGLLDNSGPVREEVPVFFILDVYGLYWFWPDWTYYAPPENTEIDYLIRNIPNGTTELEVIPEILWPDTGTSTITELYFYGAFLTPDMIAIDGEWTARSWGYGP